MVCMYVPTYLLLNQGFHCKVKRSVENWNVVENACIEVELTFPKPYSSVRDFRTKKKHKKIRGIFKQILEEIVKTAPKLDFLKGFIFESIW